MTVSADEVTADLRIKLDRKPIETPAQEALLTMMKTSYGFSWNGYGDKGKWYGKKEAVTCFEDKVFCARIKKAVKGLSFYNMAGQNVDMITFIEEVKSFDPSQLDSDLTSLGSSSVLPDTPQKDDSNKRARS